MADGFGAGGETLGEEFFVFEDKAPQLAVLGRDGVECADVNLAESLNVDRSTVLELGGDDGCE